MAEDLDKKENVIIGMMSLVAGECAVTVLPQFGGKISSIKIGERELLQPPLASIVPRTRTMGFDESDASGWDECLPSVAACSVEFAGEQAEIPDHGDLWRVEWEPVETKGEGRQTSSVSLAGKCFSLPLGLERTIFLAEIESGWRLSLAYRLTNLGSAPAPWSWAAHALFLAEAGDRIVLPETISTLRLEGSGGGRLGKNGDAVSWPLAKVASGGETDISVALPAGFRRWRQTFRRAAQRKGKLVRTCPPQNRRQNPREL